MANIPAEMVKRLRDETGAGMMDSKRALTDSDGDFDKAKDWLRVKGLARAADKASRATKEGVIDAYIHHSSGIAKQGALVEVDGRSEFVEKTDDFKPIAPPLELAVFVC